MDKYVVGIDVGGTKISIGVYSATMHCVSQCIFDTVAGEDAAINFKHIEEAIREFKKTWNISAIGICTPGPISIKRGEIVYIASLGWRNIQVVRILSDMFGVPVAFDNDANAAAYAERFVGAGKNLPAGKGNLIYVTVSTGIGAGIIVNDRILHGSRDWAGEFGHIRIRPGGKACACGNDGCLEAYASGTAIMKAASSRLNRADINCAEIASLAKAGNRVCQDIWEDMAAALGQGLSILVQLFDPHMIILGGGVMNAWPLFEEGVLRETAAGVYKDSLCGISICCAFLKQDVGRIGAALLAWQKLNNNLWRT